MKDFNHIPGYMNYHDIYDKWVGKVGLDGRDPCEYRFCEVGVFFGKGVTALAEKLRASFPDDPPHIWGVDLFEGETGDPIIDAAIAGAGGFILDRTKGYIEDCGVGDLITLIKGDSLEIAKTFPDGHFDFVLIDACHAKESVIADINAWWPKVKPGGAIGGDDADWDSVREAVVEVFGAQTCRRVGAAWEKDKPL